MNDSNPFSKMSLRYWPDFLLAISGASFVLILGAIVAGQKLPGNSVNWALLFGGLVFFGLGAKKAHYSVRVPNLPGNVWESKWRHSFISDFLALLGLILVVYSIFRFYGLLP